jgi:peptidoglycan/xylan/chitin deacetylase (PgdA/CDA1 family)
LKGRIQAAIRTIHCAFLRRPLPEKISLYFHSLTGQGKAFEELLARLLVLGYSFVGAKAFLSGKGRLAFLSFDDNYQSWHDCLPLFERYGAKATFYVNTMPFRDKASDDQIERYLNGILAHGEMTLTTGELKKIAASGHTIGAHTHTHPALTSIPFDRAKEEIITSKLILEDILGRKVVDFSYPFGMRRHFTEDLRHYCLESGFETVANAIPCMQFAESRPESIHRSPWFLEYSLDHNLDNVRVDGRLFERLTGRSAVGGGASS